MILYHTEMLLLIYKLSLLRYCFKIKKWIVRIMIFIVFLKNIISLHFIIMIMLTNMILNYLLAYKINRILRHVTFNFYIKENTMKETRNLNISFCQNGKSTQQTERLVLPTNWLRLLGISESFRKVEVTYEDGAITIKKAINYLTC